MWPCDLLTDTLVVLGILFVQALPVKYRDVMESFIDEIMTAEWFHGVYMPSAPCDGPHAGSSRPRAICEMAHAIWLPDKWQHVMLPTAMARLGTRLEKATSLQQIKFFVHCFGPFMPLFAQDAGQSVRRRVELQ